VTSVGIVRRTGAESGTRTLRLPLAQPAHSVIPDEVFGSDCGFLIGAYVADLRWFA
jgi:hypothetical protein